MVRVAVSRLPEDILQVYFRREEGTSDVQRINRYPPLLPHADIVMEVKSLGRLSIAGHEVDTVGGLYSEVITNQLTPDTYKSRECLSPILPIHACTLPRCFTTLVSYELVFLFLSSMNHSSTPKGPF